VRPPLPSGRRCFEGRFRDQFTGRWVPAFDDRFRAVQALRLVGYALAAKGWPCAPLWDPQQPQRDMYGAYSEAICAGLPPQAPQR
jgi:hypothetical protein